MRRTAGEGLRDPGHVSARAIGGGFLFVSGQPPADLAAGERVPSGARAQALQRRRNVETI